MIGTIVPYFFTITQSNWQLNSKIWKLSKSWCVVFITPLYDRNTHRYLVNFKEYFMIVVCTTKI